MRDAELALTLYPGFHISAGRSYKRAFKNHKKGGTEVRDDF